MPFIGIISKENDSNYIKNIINKNAIKSKFEVININKKSIENIKNIKFDILVICENIEKMLKESSYLEDIIKKSYYLVINSDIKENFSLLKDIEANIITYGFNAKSTITISSIKDDKLMLCLQRSIKGIFSVIEEQEFNIEIKRNNVNKLYNILVIFAILAIYGEILQKI